MELQLTPDGKPISALLTCLSERRLALVGGKPGAHPVQSINARWNTTASSLTALVEELEVLQLALYPRDHTVLSLFRKLVYDATELFDSYGQLLPERLGSLSVASSKRVKEYAAAAKRIRAPWAMICNKFKHGGAQAAFVWAVSSTGVTSPRMIVMSYRDGNALLRDDQVHNGRKGGTDLIKLTHEFVHAALRVDLQAARLIRSLDDQCCDRIPRLSGGIPIAEPLRRLAALKATVFMNEPALHDGVRLENDIVRLQKLAARRLVDPVKVSTTIQTDGITRTFSYE